MRQPIKPILNPGAAATVDLFDDGVKEGHPAIGQPSARLWFRLSIFADQVVNIQHQWRAPGAASFRNVGAAQATTANTQLTYERKLLPGQNRFQVTTTTGPGVWELAMETTDETPN